MRTPLVIGIVVLALGLTGTASSSPQGGPGAFVLPPTVKYRGKSLAEWQRAYFRWTSSIPTDGPQSHPFLAEGEVDCSYAQRGRVWFLDAGGVERRCSVPFGKTLYVPINFWFCAPEIDGIDFPECAAEGDGFLAGTESRLTLDGHTIDVEPWRTEVGPFVTRLAEANIEEFFFGVELGATTEIASDGMGVLLVLLPGRYTVTASVSSDFDGDGTREVSATSYVIDVTVRRDRHR